MNKFGYEQEWEMLIQEMVNEIDRHIKDKNDIDLTLEFLADKLGYSISRTTRKFKELSGITFRDYLRLRKLAFALADLRDANKVILDVALDYGFSSREAFSRAFKNVYGITPSMYQDNPIPVDLRKKIYTLDRHLFYIGGIEMKPALPGIPKFKCPNFEQFVRRNLNKPEGEITSEDLASLQWLDINDDICELSDLTGIEYCVNLKNLSINDWHSVTYTPINHTISDLTPLTELTELTILRLAGCKITDISPLRHLIKLKEIYLDNEISDVSLLLNLAELSTVNLGKIKSADIKLLTKLIEIKELGLTLEDIEIENMKSLAKLPNLECLWLSGNQLGDLHFLTDLTQLKQLNLSNNRISDLSPLSNLVNLELLDLENNRIEDISILSGLKKLKDLRLAGNPIKDDTAVTHLVKIAAKPLAGTPVFEDKNFEYLVRGALNKPTGNITSKDMASLEMLGSYEETMEILITNLSGIEYCVNLNTLFLLNCQIDDLEPLSDLTHLKQLHLFGNETGNNFKHLDALKNLINLEGLILYGSGINNLEGLSGLSRLTFLDLNVNPIDNIKPLRGLANLQNLSLGSVLLCDINALATLINLKSLSLNCQLLVDINPLSKLINLESLRLYSDLLVDISVVSNLTKLNHLYLHGSPVIDYSPADHVKNLEK